MPAYIHGNLAVQERDVPKQKTKEVRKTAVRRRTLPAQDKLFILFAIVVCCVIAGVIIWRYAQIYEMNARMQQIERDIKGLEIENDELKLQVSKLQSPERLIESGKQLGLLPPGERIGTKEQNQATASAPASSTAKKTSKDAVAMSKSKR